MESKDLLARLRNDVLNATEATKIASVEYHTVLNDIPSGLPSPDGKQRIQNAGQRFRVAEARSQKALLRLQDYVLKGKIPGDGPYEP